MIMEEITNRKSVRSYNEQPVSDETVAEILEAGRLAPSWMNVQPWKFIAVRDETTKEVLCRASGGQKHVLTAPVVIATIADLSAWDRPKLAAILKKLGKGENVDVYLDNKTLNPTLISQFETMARTIEQVTYATAYMTL